MNILVTGANGFLGKEIVRQMVDSGMQFRATDKQKESVFPDMDYRPADIIDSVSLGSVVQGADCVIHVAGLAHVFR